MDQDSPEQSVWLRPIQGGTDPANVANVLDALQSMFTTLPTDPAAAGFAGPLSVRRGQREVLVPIPPTLSPSVAQGVLATRLRKPIGTMTDVIITTSGITPAHFAGLSRGAIIASAEATHAHLSGPGIWVLTQPTDTIEGFMTVARAVHAGTRPQVVDSTRGFNPQAVVRAVQRSLGTPPPNANDDTPPNETPASAKLAESGQATELPVYMCITAEQLWALLGLSPEHIAVLRQCSAILVNASAAHPGLLERAFDIGLPVIETYGHTLTCGGCVYNGLPLPGVQVAAIENNVWITGTVLGQGYVDFPGNEGFVALGARRWLRTADTGFMDGPRLIVLGRHTEMINTGGVKVNASAVEASTATVEGVAQASVIGLPHPHWGHLVTVAIVPDTDVDPAMFPPFADDVFLANNTPQPQEQVVDQFVGLPGHVSYQDTAPSNTHSLLDMPQTRVTPQGEGTVHEIAAEYDAKSLPIQIRNTVGAELGSAHAPRVIFAVRAFPRLSTGKVDKRALTELAEYAMEHNCVWLR